MPRNLTTGIFTRVSNSFSNPVYGTVIDPTDADALFDDYDGGLTFNDSEPLILVGSTSGVLTILAPDTASGTITLPAGTTDFSATGGTGQYVKQASSGGAFTVATVPASEISAGAALTRVDDTNVTLTLGGTPSTSLLAATSITAGWTGQLSLARGGTNASLTASNGGLLYSTASAAAILAGTATAGQIPRSGSSAAPSWSTATYPATTAAGTILASSTANTITGTATPTLGVAGSVLGSLSFAGNTSGTITITPQAAAGTYNFNLPTGAGTSGQPLLSGGGGASAMTFGTLGVAAGGTGLTSGTSGGILGFTASGTLASSAALGANGVVIGGGAGATPTAITAGTNGQLLLGVTGLPPAMASMSGDATIANTGAVTIANSAVTNAKLANSAAYSLKGNFTGSSAAPQDSTIGALTQKASPGSNDLVLIQDQSAAGQLKYTSVSAISAGGAVASIAGNTGAFTLHQPITNETNDIVLNATITPQGRLTLTTGTPVMSTDTLAATTLYYTPYEGNLVPIYNGTNFIPTAFSELSVSLASSANWASGSLYDWFVINDGGTTRLASGPAWATSSSRGTGAGTTEIQMVNGVWMNAVSMTARYGASSTTSVSANRGTYIGTTYMTANGQTGMSFSPAAAAGGTNNILGVYNAYNRVDITSMSRDNTSSWTYASATFRSANGSNSNRISWVDGLKQSFVNCQYTILMGNEANTGAIALGFDSTSSVSGFANVGNGSFTPATAAASTAPLLGFHYAQAIEAALSAASHTFFGMNGSTQASGVILNVQI